MAYEGAVQICLDSLLHGVPSPATNFLVNGCKGLKEALALGILLLPSAGYEQGNETSIYWDDREEGGGAVLERVTVQAQDRFTDFNKTSDGGGSGSQYLSRKNPAFQEDLTGTQRQNEYKTTSPIPRHEIPPAPAAPTTAASLGMSPLGNGHEVAQDHNVLVRNSSTISVGPLAATSTESVIPVIEASITRVVGCPMLAAIGSTNNSRSRSSKSGQRRFTVVMHPAGSPAPKDARAWTTVLPNGATEDSGVLRLLPDSPRGTVLVAVYADNCQVAAGTVQAAELQRCALQHDSLDEEAPMGAGFLRNLVPAFARRKDTLQQGSVSSMTWVRLVDSEGADAGHIVVSAKLVTNASAAASDSSIGNQPLSVAATPPPPPSAPPPSTAAVAMLGVGAAIHTNQSFEQDIYTTKNRKEMRQKDHRDDGYSYQEQQQLVTRIDIRGAGVGGRAHTAGGYLHVKSQHVYDILLESSLVAAGCGPSSLELTGPWAWLVEQHAQRYGVRKQYATLAYLRWVVRSDNAAPTKACLGTLSAKLGPLLAERDSVALTSSELALLGHVVERVDQLITSCFEHYFALSEDVLGGLADGMLSVRTVGAPPKALAPAVELLKMTRGTEIGPDGGISWLTSRLRAAARKRFQALLAATESRRAPNDRRRGGAELSHRTGGGAAAGSNEIDDPSMAWSYSRVEELCSCVVSELRADESIAAAGVLPESISLPAITAVEFIRGTISYLQHVLQHSPPPSPSPAAVRLVESVGRLQSFLERHGFEDAAARLNSRDIFGGFVAEWVAGTANNLRRTLRALDRAGPPALSGWEDLQTGVKTRAAPLVEGMLSEVEAEMRRYARIVAYWPAYGQDLEAALVSVLRETTSAASGQCGLVQSKVEDVITTPPGSKHTEPVFMHRSTGSAHGSGAKPTIEGKKFGRVAWRWIQVGSGGQGSAFADAPTPLRKGINPHQALLLNSLRRLLAVVPQLELALRGWCAGTGAGADPRQSTVAGMHGGDAAADGGSGKSSSKGEERLSRDAPDLGAHWAQLVKEIRTEYYVCCTLTVESLAGELSRSSATSVIAVLRREALTAAPAAVTKYLRKVLEQTAPNLRWLAAALDGRVFVALARGLWDNAAKDVLRYAEDLTDGGVSGAAQGAWRARQGAGAALRALDAFYRAELAAAMGSDLLDRDLALPQHAQRAAALLADNTVEVNMSFDVY
jgi:hypothetical protein